MGGIIGKLSFERDEPLARPAFEQMLDALGPPEAGHYERHIEPGVALGSTTSIASRGHLFVAADADATDADAIATAFLHAGSRCFAELEGAFTCIVWDAQARRLTLARDHIGIRQLYFALLPGHGVVFGSQLNALFHDPGVGRECHPPAIDAYLALGYVPAPLTAFKRISKLEPAQLIVIEGRRLHAERYWSLPDTLHPTTVDAAALQLDAHLRMATRRQVCHPACSVLLSGGPASAALAAVLPPGGGPAVTIALDQKSVDIARAYALGEALGKVPDIEVAAFAPEALVSEVASQFEEPMADPAALTQFAVCSAARHFTDAAVTGHGAAAMFDVARRRAVWDDEDRRAIYTRTFAWEVREVNPRARYQDLCEEHGADDALDRARYVQLRSILPEHTLVIARSASLFGGVTLEYPWLDRHLVEFAATLPSALGASARTAMPVVMRLLEGRLPASLLPRPEHESSPAWLRPVLSATVPRVLLGPRFDGRGIISRPALRRLWDEHCSGRHDHALRFWSLLMLEFWFREHIDDDAAEQPLEYAILKAA